MTTWQKLSIYTSEATRWGTRPLHSAVIATALEKGLYCAMALRAMEGFGPQHAIPTANQMALASDLPIEIRIFDQAAAIAAFLDSEQEMLQDCIVVVESVEVQQAPTPTTV